MSSSDQSKLDEIANGAIKNIITYGERFYKGHENTPSTNIKSTRFYTNRFLLVRVTGIEPAAP